jgi:hypothetical protein
MSCALFTLSWQTYHVPSKIRSQHIDSAPEIINIVIFNGIVHFVFLVRGGTKISGKKKMRNECGIFFFRENIVGESNLKRQPQHIV